MKDSKKIKDIEDSRVVKVFLDDEEQPFGEFRPPVEILLDTTKIPDGEHELRVVAKTSGMVEGVKIIPFTVKNGPEISVIGLKSNQTISTETSVIINAYGSETTDRFIVKGSEDPKAIPAWVWMLVILFIAFGVFYLIMYLEPGQYNSPF